MKAKSYQIGALTKQLNTTYKIALIHGLDFSVVQDCAQQIITSILPQKTDFSLIKVSSSALKSNPSLLLDEANTISFLAPEKIIWVNDCTDKDETLKSAVFDFESHVKTNAFLLLTGSLFAKSSALRLFAENQPNILEIACYEDTPAQKKAYVQHYLKSRNLSIDPSDFSTLTNRISDNRLMIKSELEKLELYLDDRKKITLQDIDNIISDATFSSAELLCHAIGLGQRYRSERFYNLIIAEGETPVAITRMLMMYFNKLLIGISVYEKNHNQEEALKKILRPNQFNLKDDTGIQIRRLNKPTIIKILSLLLETEIQLKSSTLPPDLTLGRTITLITATTHKLVGG